MAFPDALYLMFGVSLIHIGRVEERHNVHPVGPTTLEQKVEAVFCSFMKAAASQMAFVVYLLPTFLDFAFVWYMNLSTLVSVGRAAYSCEVPELVMNTKIILVGLLIE